MGEFLWETKRVYLPGDRWDSSLANEACLHSMVLQTMREGEGEGMGGGVYLGEGALSSVTYLLMGRKVICVRYPWPGGSNKDTRHNLKIPQGRNNGNELLLLF